MCLDIVSVHIAFDLTVSAEVECDQNDETTQVENIKPVHQRNVTNITFSYWELSPVNYN